MAPTRKIKNKPLSRKRRRRSARSNTFLPGHYVRFTTEELSRVPVKERTLLLGLWHITNELHALRKLVLLADGTKARGKIEKAAVAFNSLLFISLFSVKAYEAWKFFAMAKNFSEFRTVYLNDPDAADLLEKRKLLGKYFGKASNLLVAIRNSLGAHYDYPEISSSSGDIGDIDSFAYIAEQQGNCLYYVGDEVLWRGVLKRLALAGESVRSTLGRVIDDVHSVADSMTDLAQGVSIVAIKNASLLDHLRSSPAKRARARKSNKHDLPLFVDFSPPKPKRRK